MTTAAWRQPSNGSQDKAMLNSKKIWVDWNDGAWRWAGWAVAIVFGLAATACVTETKMSLEGDTCSKSADCAGQLRCRHARCTDGTDSVSTSSPIVTRPFPGDGVPRLR